MKKYMSMLMILAMLLTMLPMGVMATEEEIQEPAPVTALYVGSVNALETPEGDGWRFDAETGVLTLENCTLTEAVTHEVTYRYSEDDEGYTERYNSILYFQGDLTIELVGINSLKRTVDVAPEVETAYYAIHAGLYQENVDGDIWDMPSKLSIRGDGTLTAGLLLANDCLDEDGYDAWENLWFSCAIFCNAEHGVDLTGLEKGSCVEVYAGVTDYGAYYNARPWNTAPTFGSNAAVTTYMDLEGTEEIKYNENENNGARIKIMPADAYLNSMGLLSLMDTGAASGHGWSWENNVLTLSSDTEVKAVEFRQQLGSAKLLLAGDVTLDSTDMGYDANWNAISPVNANCDLEIRTGSHTLYFAGEGDSNAIFANNSDVVISDSTLENTMEYGGGILVQGGSLTMQDSSLRSSDEIYVTTGYDEEWNSVMGGDIWLLNADITLGESICNSDGSVFVEKSKLTLSGDYAYLFAAADASLSNSDVTMNNNTTALEANGALIIDNCNLDITAEEVLSCGYSSGGQADISKLQLLNMNITLPKDYQILAVNSNWNSQIVKLTNSDGTVATTLVATAAESASPILKLTEDTDVELSLTADLYVDLNGYDLTGTVITNGYTIYGMDSTTDNYTCDRIGYMQVTDENGDPVTPASHFKSNITGTTKRYLTVNDENGYSFHRFYLGITHMSLKPATTSFGYRADFYADTMAQTQIASIGYNLWITEENVVSRTAGFQNQLTLRLQNIDVANHGQTSVNANVYITLLDGSVIESSVVSRSMRDMLEALNTQYTTLSNIQRFALKVLIEEYEIIKSWDTENLYA